MTTAPVLADDLSGQPDLFPESLPASGGDDASAVHKEALHPALSGSDVLADPGELTKLNTLNTAGVLRYSSLEIFSYGSPNDFENEWNQEKFWFKHEFQEWQINGIQGIKRIGLTQHLYDPTHEPVKKTKLDLASWKKLRDENAKKLGDANAPLKACITEGSLNAQQSETLKSILEDCLNTDFRMEKVKAKCLNEVGAEVLEDRRAIIGVDAHEANAVIKRCYVNMVAAVRARGEDVSKMDNPAKTPIELLTIALVNAKIGGQDIGLVAPRDRNQKSVSGSQTNPGMTPNGLGQTRKDPRGPGRQGTGSRQDQSGPGRGTSVLSIFRKRTPNTTRP